MCWVLQAAAAATLLAALPAFAQNAAMNAGDDDIQAQAAQWIEDNRADVDTWLEAARAAS